MEKCDYLFHLILQLEFELQEFFLILTQTIINTNNKYLLIFKTWSVCENFFVWTGKKVNSNSFNGFDLGMAKFLMFRAPEEIKDFHVALVQCRAVRRNSTFRRHALTS